VNVAELKKINREREKKKRTPISSNVKEQSDETKVKNKIKHRTEKFTC
jgi:hypothetical protein